MMNLFNKYEKVSPLLLVFQIGIFIKIICNFVGIVLTILSGLSVISVSSLTKSWMSLFLPNYNFNIVNIIFPSSFKTGYLLHIFLYANISDMIFLIFLYYSTINLKKIFQNFEVKKETFSRINAILFKKIAIATVIMLIIKFAVDFGYGMFISLLINSFEKGNVGITFGIQKIFVGMLIAAIFFGLSFMFSQGADLKEENDSII